MIVVPLGAVSRADIATVGSKAANLGDLIQAGFRVPPGFVLTTDAFACFLRSNQLDLAGGPEAVRNAPIPDVIRDALHSAATSLGEGPLAVRSSATAEDLAVASFAGHTPSTRPRWGFRAKSCWTLCVKCGHLPLARASPPIVRHTVCQPAVWRSSFRR